MKTNTPNTRFKLLKQLGQGSFSTIYSAFDLVRN